MREVMLEAAVATVLTTKLQQQGHHLRLVHSVPGFPVVISIAAF